MKTVILAIEDANGIKSKTPFALHKLLDKPIISYVVENAKKLNSDEIYILTSENDEKIMKELGNEELCFINLSDALISHMQEDKQFLVLYGNIPLITKDTCEKLMEKHNNEKNSVTLLTTTSNSENSEKKLELSQCLGKFSNDNENSECNSLTRESFICGYLFNGNCLNLVISKLKEAGNGFNIKNVLAALLKNNETIGSLFIEEETELIEVNDCSKLYKAQKILQEKINRCHMQNGVIIIDPNSTYIGEDVKIEGDTIIYPNTFLEGKTEIGQECIIGANSKLVNMKIGVGCQIEYSVLKDSEIGSHTNVGPFAYVRPNCHIGSHCKIGDFVEVKNSIIGDKSKASHLTYVGDSEVGSHVNFGCGTVTVNYNGKSKAKTIIKDDVFIGCNTNLVAPVTVHEGAFIAAGSTITDDVPKKALSIARSRQVNKTGWTLD